MNSVTLNLKSNQIAFRNFKSFIRARNYKAITNYISPVLEFLNWSEVHGITRINNISQLDMNKYFGYLTTRPNIKLGGTLSESSIKGHILALNILFEMLLNSGVIERAFVFPTFNLGGKQQRNILTIDEVKELLSHCKNQLERCIINIGYGCGLRRKEMEMLNVHDVQINKCCLVVRTGKNNKRREVPLTDPITRELKEYIISYRPQLLKDTKKLEKAFFINSKGYRMSGDLLNDTLKYIIRRTKNAEIIEKNITLHCLRHSISTHLQEAGAKIEFIRDFLGHLDIDTSLLYMVRRKKQFVIA